MKHWQKSRNYRKQKNDDGSVTYIITVDGQDVEVNEEVYKAYSGADRRERYIEEREDGIVLSLDQMREDGVPIDLLTRQYVESAEDTAIRNIMGREAMSALQILAPEERQVIQAVVLEDVTEQEFADLLGLTQAAVHKRKNRALAKLSKILGY